VPGRHMASLARIKPLSRLGRDSLVPAGPARPTPRLGRVSSVRLGQSTFSRLGRDLLCWLGRSLQPRLGRRPLPRLGRRPPSPGWASFFTAPGWAGSGGSGLVGIIFPSCFLQHPAGLGFVYSGRARPGFPWPRPDFLFPGRLSPFGAEIHHLWDVFFIRHRLHHPVPVLGCLLAQTGTSFIVICWSWDAPWLRPAYSTSPSQPYPQEEDKTDDMKTDARRRSQVLQGQSRWDKPMTMTPATVPSTVPQ
jgi:hypothetical protein